jgi:hypothetical protein
VDPATTEARQIGMSECEAVDNTVLCLHR